jgi:hypothetical protein
MKVRPSILILAAMILCSLTSILVYFFLQSIYPPEVPAFATAIPMRIQVADFIGFDVNNSQLNFGAVTPSGRSRRNITVTNTFEDTVQVNMEFEGEMEPWMSGYESKFILSSGQAREFMLVVSPPLDVSKGDYNGTAIVSFYQAK